MSYSAVFVQASISPCMDVDASTSYCMRVVDLQNSFMIVSTDTQQSRRLLLEVGSDDVLRLNALSTLHPPCQDALDSAADTFVRCQCVTRYVRNAETVAHLGLHANVARCAFCSSEDAWHMLAQDPMILPFLVVHPHKRGSRAGCSWRSACRARRRTSCWCSRAPTYQTTWVSTAAPQASCSRAKTRSCCPTMPCCSCRPSCVVRQAQATPRS